MEVKFIKVSPTQNMTILIESDVPLSERLNVGKKIMDYSSVFAEQVGYISTPENPAAWGRLDMIAGEFCGNATMSLAAVIAKERKIPLYQTHPIPLETSGLEGVVTCMVRPEKDHFLCTLQMPEPKSLEHKTLELDEIKYHVCAVDMNGITHIIVPVEQINGNKKEFAEKAVRVWQKIFKTEAFGILLYDKQKSVMDPLVFIESADSLVWERGCGSGTAAVGSFLAMEAKQSHLAAIKQPGGTIAVESIYQAGSVTKVSITGEVRITARGIAYLY